jgi:hypothetical protein
MITAEEPSYEFAITEGTVNSDVYTETLGSSLLDTMGYFGLDKKTSDFSKIMQVHTLLVLPKYGSSAMGSS